MAIEANIDPTARFIAQLGKAIKELRELNSLPVGALIVATAPDIGRMIDRLDDWYLQLTEEFLRE